MTAVERPGEAVRILLVDDDDDFRGMLRDGLEEAGYRVLEASEGSEALKRLASGLAADAVVTDVVMPGREGIETLREVRRLRPRLPVIVISGGGAYGKTSYLEMARILGADRVLQKPFALEALLGVLEDVLAGRS